MPQVEDQIPGEELGTCFNAPLRAYHNSVNIHAALRDFVRPANVYRFLKEKRDLMEICTFRASNGEMYNSQQNRLHKKVKKK